MGTDVGGGGSSRGRGRRPLRHLTGRRSTEGRRRKAHGVESATARRSSGRRQEQRPHELDLSERFHYQRSPGGRGGKRVRRSWHYCSLLPISWLESPARYVRHDI